MSMQTIISAAAFVIPFLIISLSVSLCDKCGENRFAPVGGALAGMLVCRLIPQSVSQSIFVNLLIALSAALIAGCLAALPYLLSSRRVSGNKLICALPVPIVLALSLFGTGNTMEASELSASQAAILSAAVLIALSLFLMLNKKLRLTLSAVGESSQSARDIVINAGRAVMLAVMLASAASALSGALLSVSQPVSTEIIIAISLAVCAVSYKSSFASVILTGCLTLAAFLSVSVLNCEQSLAAAVLTFAAALIMPFCGKR